MGKRAVLTDLFAGRRTERAQPKAGTRGAPIPARRGAQRLYDSRTGFDMYALLDHGKHVVVISVFATLAQRFSYVHLANAISHAAA